MSETSSLISEPHVYGRDDSKKNIICQLLDDKPSYENYVVNPITGMGGIGKTTLAQYVYNDEQVKSYFDLKAWVCVSDVFDVKRITKYIINSVTQGNFDCSNLNQAQEKWQQLLKGQKFFIVLDDVWSEEYLDWNQLQTPFLGAARGSRVILTSRSEKTARMVMRNYRHNTIIYLERLSDEDCWCIFQRHVIEFSDLSEMQNDIVRKCKGLPLAAKSLGGLLRKAIDKSHHQRILDSNIWSEESSVLPVLRLSYHHLPSHLKRLFAYCCMLPKVPFSGDGDHKLWMAQGFLPENTNERIEDVGHNCFLDLVSRSLIEEYTPDVEEFIFEEGLRIFTMHDLIHDLAKWAAGDLCCVIDTVNNDLKRTRHMFVTETGVNVVENQLLASQLRTFLYSSSNDLNIEILNYIQHFRYSRTLRLSSMKIRELLPECIGDLKYLKLLTVILK